MLQVLHQKFAVPLLAKKIPPPPPPHIFCNPKGHDHVVRCCQLVPVLRQIHYTRLHLFLNFQFNIISLSPFRYPAPYLIFRHVLETWLNRMSLMCYMPCPSQPPLFLTCHMICHFNVRFRGVLPLWEPQKLFAAFIRDLLTFWRRNYFFNFSTSCI